MAADKGCVLRLQKELRAILKEPAPNVLAKPSPANILEWHYVLLGAEGTDFAGGVYHGKLSFPSDYPFKPPSVTMLTPSGRFAPGKQICMSMTNFHPELWNPLWSVSSILTGLLSFMSEDAPTAGSVSAPPAERRALAAGSLAFNVLTSPPFRKLFPELVEEHAKRVAEAEAKAAEAERAAAEAAAAAAAARDATGGAGPGAAVGGAAAAPGLAAGASAVAPPAGMAWLWAAAVLFALLGVLGVLVVGDLRP